MGKLSAFPSNTGPGLTDQVIMIVGGVDVKVTLQTLLGLLIPSGTITEFAGSTAPSGYLFCDGSAVSRTTYSALFTAIGTTYGAGDGSTTFNLPDHRGRVAVGKNAGTFAALGQTGGEETHVLSQGEMPVHNHGISSGIGYGAGGYNPALGRADANSPANLWGSFNVGNSGGGGAHNNLQPYLTVNHIIKT